MLVKYDQITTHGRIWTENSFQREMDFYESSLLFHTLLYSVHSEVCVSGMSPSCLSLI